MTEFAKTLISCIAIVLCIAIVIFCGGCSTTGIITAKEYHMPMVVMNVNIKTSKSKAYFYPKAWSIYLDNKYILFVQKETFDSVNIGERYRKQKQDIINRYREEIETNY